MNKGVDLSGVSLPLVKGDITEGVFNSEDAIYVAKNYNSIIEKWSFMKEKMVELVQ